jgi:hypothetical protein
LDRWPDCQRNRNANRENRENDIKPAVCLAQDVWRGPCSPPKSTDSKRFGINWDILGYGHWDISADTKRLAQKTFLQKIPTMSPKSLNAHVKLPHSVIVKSTGLHPMFYTIRKLAEEIAIPKRTLCDWLLHGAPHTRDRLNHIWIDGRAFAN